MRDWIIDIARDLLRAAASAHRHTSITLDEIAACAGISRSHLRAYYSSVAAIEADLAGHESWPASPARQNSPRT